MIPSRLSEKAFRFYELPIRSIVCSWPGPIVFDPASYHRSPETFACRLRDAMRSLRDWRWPSSVALDRFLALHNQVVVSITDQGMVRVGTKESLCLKSVPTMDIDPTDVLHISANTSELHLLGLLAHHRALAKPLILTITDPATVEALCSKFDIDLVQQEDGAWRLT